MSHVGELVSAGLASISSSLALACPSNPAWMERLDSAAMADFLS
jgi:hypothetical protein